MNGPLGGERAGPHRRAAGATTKAGTGELPTSPAANFPTDFWYARWEGFVDPREEIFHLIHLFRCRRRRRLDRSVRAGDGRRWHGVVERLGVWRRWAKASVLELAPMLWSAVVVVVAVAVVALKLSPMPFLFAQRDSCSSMWRKKGCSGIWRTLRMVPPSPPPPPPPPPPSPSTIPTPRSPITEWFHPA